MRFRFDMDAVTPERRLRRFREVVAAANGRNSVVYRFGTEAFTAQLSARTSGERLLAVTTTSSHSLTLAPTAAGAGTDEILVFAFNSGSPLETVQGRREARIETGDVAFVSRSRPFQTICGDVGHRVYLNVVKSDLEERLGAIDDLAARSFSSKLAAQRLASRYFAALGAALDTLDEAAFERRFGDGLDLLAFAMQEQIGGGLRNTTVHRSALRIRLKSLILSRLDDPAFSLAEAAAAFGVSPRYVNDLLADDGTSFGRFVLERRLLACRRELGDPRFATRPVIDIAFRWGFNDAAHFSRAFRTRFGLPPREYRRDIATRRLTVSREA